MVTMGYRRTVTRSLLCTGIAVLVCLTTISPADAQSSDADGCDDIIAVGMLSSDGFPDDSVLYTNTEDSDDVRGKFVSSTEDYLIWYSPTDPTEYTSDTADAALTDCTGLWVISTYPIGDTFSDLVWYQADDCSTTPPQISSDEWERMERECNACDDTVSTSNEVVISCLVTEEEEEETNGISTKTLIIVIIIVGVGFMVFMCLGALACCIRGKNSPEEAIMPPGELGDSSVIGGKAQQDLKPGLHAHPEVRGAQHPRPEDDSSSQFSISQIPQGSRSGPSVRSIGYS